jgi:dihydroorotate dehydrogenase (fumarate)
MLNLMNAAGMVKFPADVEPLLKLDPSVLEEITLGSYTLEPRDGNSGTPFWTDKAAKPTSINSMGLPNPGIDAALEFLPEVFRKIRDSGKHVRVSIAGFSVDDYAQLAEKVAKLNPDEIEFNLGCPNTKHKMLARDPQDFERVLRIAETVYRLEGPHPVIKLSPYEPELFKEIASIIKPRIHFVRSYVISNTVPNAYGLVNGGSAITPNNGLGGLGGYAVKHIALGQVRQFKLALGDAFEFIGCGGVSSWQDVLDLRQAGARRVQIGTAFFVQGPSVFQRIAEEHVAVQ